MTAKIYSGKELTYKGHAGVGRPVPAPYCSHHRLDTPTYLFSTPTDREIGNNNAARPIPNNRDIINFN